LDSANKEIKQKYICIYMSISESVKEMDRLITAFPENMIESLAIGAKSSQSYKTQPVSNVVISGLGGSGIGGKIISQLVWDQCTVPIALVHDYRLPAWISAETLFIACSYSGNTEETLSTVEEARRKNAQIACITSGGKLKALAELEGYNHAVIPGGQPPRTSFGYNALQLFFILHAYHLIPMGFKEQLEKAARFLQTESSSIKVEAAAIAKKIAGTTPVIYAETYFEGVAVRLRQQINENAKMLCWHHVLPEMNHNELVGWAGGNENFSAILIRTSEDHPGTKHRMELSLEIIRKYTDKIVELTAKGTNRIEEVYYLIHLSDWISFYLAIERKVDPIEIQVIDYFKSELAKG